MKKIGFVAALVVSAFVAMGCKTTMPVSGGSGKVGSKVGEATATYILGFCLNPGDASIATAAKNGGISEVGVVDMRIEKPILIPVFQKVVTVVSGN